MSSREKKNDLSPQQTNFSRLYLLKTQKVFFVFPKACTTDALNTPPIALQILFRFLFPVFSLLPASIRIFLEDNLHFFLNI